MLELGKLLTAFIAPPFNTFCVTDYCSDSLSCSFQKISQIYCAYQFHLALYHGTHFLVGMAQQIMMTRQHLDDYKQAQAIVMY